MMLKKRLSKVAQSPFIEILSLKQTFLGAIVA